MVFLKKQALTSKTLLTFTINTLNVFHKDDPCNKNKATLCE